MGNRALVRSVMDNHHTDNKEATMADPVSFAKAYLQVALDASGADKGIFLNRLHQYVLRQPWNMPRILAALVLRIYLRPRIRALGTVTQVIHHVDALMAAGTWQDFYTAEAQRIIAHVQAQLDLAFGQVQMANALVQGMLANGPVQGLPANALARAQQANVHAQAQLANVLKQSQQSNVLVQGLLALAPVQGPPAVAGVQDPLGNAVAGRCNRLTSPPLYNRRSQAHPPPWRTWVGQSSQANASQPAEMPDFKASLVSDSTVSESSGTFGGVAVGCDPLNLHLLCPKIFKCARSNNTCNNNCTESNNNRNSNNRSNNDKNGNSPCNIT